MVAPVKPDLVRLYDGEVVQARGEARLLEKHLPQLGFSAISWRSCFTTFSLANLRTFRDGEVDRAHAAAAEL